MKSLTTLLVPSALLLLGCNLILGTEEGVLATGGSGGGGGGDTPQCVVAQDCSTVLDCRVPDCVDGLCVAALAPPGTGCGINAALMCDAAGQCAGCSEAAQCGADTECATYTCDANSICQSGFQPAGTPLTDPTPGDCQAMNCAGDSPTPMAVADDADVVTGGPECIDYSCFMGVASVLDSPAGLQCSGGAGYCNGMGACQISFCGDSIIDIQEQCDLLELGGQDCASLGQGSGVLACTQTCVFDLASCSCGNGATDGDETDIDCGGSCLTDCSAGQTCVVNEDCVSAVCTLTTCD